MSRALDYLMQLRAEAMGNYFAFIKEAGKNLDPKTRNIISVITKVDKQTEKGLQQYLKRALREGVSAAEIIDSLLLASPTLGLSKIIWALDIIIQMDLAEFQLEELLPKACWHDVVEVLELGEGLAFYEVKGRGFFVYKEAEAIQVYSNICSHQGSQLRLTDRHDDVLVCPRHEWQFDCRNGACVSAMGKALQHYQHKIEQGKLWVSF